jgi:membrane protein YdbS with pleckstrin-like domain
MNFEDLQSSWQLQQVAEPEKMEVLQDTLDNNWSAYQRGLRRSNMILSVSFMPAFLVMGWVYYAFHAEYSWPFAMSIAVTYLLMFVYLGVVWRSYAFKKYRMDVPAVEYISYQLKKISWQRLVLTRFSIVYALLLLLAINLYIWEVSTGGSVLFRVSAFTISDLYIIGINIWYVVKKQPVQLETIDTLREELLKIKRDLMN